MPADMTEEIYLHKRQKEPLWTEHSPLSGYCCICGERTTYQRCGPAWFCPLCKLIVAESEMEELK
jgi:hypothetical protein